MDIFSTKYSYLDKISIVCLFVYVFVFVSVFFKISKSIEMFSFVARIKIIKTWKNQLSSCHVHCYFVIIFNDFQLLIKFKQNCWLCQSIKRTKKNMETLGGRIVSIESKLQRSNNTIKNYVPLHHSKFKYF